MGGGKRGVSADQETFSYATNLRLVIASWENRGHICPNYMLGSRLPYLPREKLYKTGALKGKGGGVWSVARGLITRQGALSLSLFCAASI